MNINPTPLDVVDIAEQQKNEENTKLNKITPIILDRWKDLSTDKILMEYYFTNGRISVDEYNEAHRGQPKKVDYLLLYYNNVPIALVEAKGEDHAASEGYQQAVEYARLLDVPFAYTTNGDDLIEKDMIAGTNKNMKIVDFPYKTDPYETIGITCEPGVYFTYRSSVLPAVTCSRVLTFSCVPSAIFAWYLLM